MGRVVAVAPPGAAGETTVGIRSSWIGSGSSGGCWFGCRPSNNEHFSWLLLLRAIPVARPSPSLTIGHREGECSFESNGMRRDVNGGYAYVRYRYLYYYPETCSPKGHGCRSASAYCNNTTVCENAKQK